MPISQDVAAPDSAASDARLEGFVREIHLGHYAEVSRALCELPRRDMHLVVRLLVATEKENPLTGSMSPELKANLPLTRIVAQMLDADNDVAANALLEAGYTFRTEVPERAIYHLTQLAVAFEARDDHANLAEAYLWQALVDSDRRDFDACLRNTWRCLSRAHHVLRNEVEDSIGWRKAVRCLAGAQHQFGIVCRLEKDFENALLYYHRSLAVARHVDDWRRMWATEGSIGNVFLDEGYLDRCLLHELHSLVACLRGQGSPEMAPVALGRCYKQLGNIYDTADDYEVAVRLYRRSHELSIVRRELLPRICLALCELEQTAAAELYLAELLAAPMGVGTRDRYHSYLVRMSLCKRLGKASERREVVASFLSWILEERVLLQANDEMARTILSERLDATPDEAHGARGLLQYALGRRAVAVTEFEKAANDVAEGERAVWEGLGDRVKAESNESQPDSEEVERSPCRSCGQQVPRASLSRDDRCEACHQARALEDLVSIPGGKVALSNGQTVEVGPFGIDRTPVTNRWFRLYARATGLTWEPSSWSNGVRRLDNQPVACVSRQDAEAFCAWRSQVTGRRFRLPSAEEWLRAALGDDDRAYPWGNEPPDHTRAAFATCDDPDAVPPPVGMFEAGASPFGVMDMAGTVFEWTSTENVDGYPLRLGGASSSEPKYLNPRYLMAMDLDPAPADSRTHADIGFRCVCDEAAVASGGQDQSGEYSRRRS